MAAKAQELYLFTREHGSPENYYKASDRTQISLQVEPGQQEKEHSGRGIQTEVSMVIEKCTTLWRISQVVSCYSYLHIPSADSFCL